LLVELNRRGIMIECEGQRHSPSSLRLFPFHFAHSFIPFSTQKQTQPNKPVSYNKILLALIISHQPISQLCGYMNTHFFVECAGMGGGWKMIASFDKSIRRREKQFSFLLDCIFWMRKIFLWQTVTHKEQIVRQLCRWENEELLCSALMNVQELIFMQQFYFCFIFANLKNLKFWDLKKTV